MTEASARQAPRSTPRQPHPPDVPMPRPSGWYRQPDGGHRWWDGREWTSHVRAEGTPTAEKSTNSGLAVRTEDTRTAMKGTNSGLAVQALRPGANLNISAQARTALLAIGLALIFLLFARAIIPNDVQADQVPANTTRSSGPAPAAPEPSPTWSNVDDGKRTVVGDGGTTPGGGRFWRQDRG